MSKTTTEERKMTTSDTQTKTCDDCWKVADLHTVGEDRLCWDCAEGRIRLADFSVGDRVQTVIAAPHPAACEGTVYRVGEKRVGVRDDMGIERAYTPRSLVKV